MKRKPKRPPIPSERELLELARACRQRTMLDPGARCGDVLLPAARALELMAKVAP